VSCMRRKCGNCSPVPLSYVEGFPANGCDQRPLQGACASIISENKSVVMITSTPSTVSSHLSYPRTETGSRSAHLSPPTDKLRPAFREALDAREDAVCGSIVMEGPMEVALLKAEGGFLEQHEVSEVNQQPDSPRKMAQIVKILRTKGDEVFHGFLRWLCAFGHDSQVQELAESAGLKSAIATEPDTGSPGQQRLRLRPVAVVKPLVVKPRNLGVPNGRRAVFQRLTRVVQTGCRNGARLAIFATIAGSSAFYLTLTGMIIGSFLPSVGAVWGGCALATVGAAVTAKAATQVGGRTGHVPYRPDDAGNTVFTTNQLLQNIVVTRQMTCWEATRLVGFWGICSAISTVSLALTEHAGLLAFGGGVGGFCSACLLGSAVGVTLLFGLQGAEQRLVGFLNRPTNPGDGIRAPATALPG